MKKNNFFYDDKIVYKPWGYEYIVYRNLKQLEISGEIKTIYDDNIARYDWNTEPHNHLKCKNCGDLIDIVLSDKSIPPKIKKDFKFNVDKVEMFIIGTCKKHAKT